MCHRRCHGPKGDVQSVCLGSEQLRLPAFQDKERRLTEQGGSQIVDFFWSFPIDHAGSGGDLLLLGLLGGVAETSLIITAQRSSKGQMITVRFPLLVVC